MTLKLTQLSLLCPVCGADVPPSGRRGPRRTYCTEACRLPIDAESEGWRSIYRASTASDGGA
jgi:endogenous inhibitor of DNA gyrase (YacG/DUF329 family)